MDRAAFEILRDLSDKRIDANITFGHKDEHRPLLVADNVPVLHSGEADLKIHLHYNPETGSKTVVACVQGVGPICRLDVDGPAHGAAGRSHKHALQTERCPELNLPDGVAPKAQLSGKTMREVFEDFCSASQITMNGNFSDPEQ